MNEISARARLPLAIVRAATLAPRTTLTAWVVTGLLLLPLIAGLHVDTSTESVLDRSDPAWDFYRYSQSLFGGDELLVVALEGERPFDPDLLGAVRRLSDALEGLEGVRRVDSIATVPVVRAGRDGSLSLDAALDTPAEGDALAAEARRRLTGDRIAPGNLVSADGRAFGINVVLDEDAEAIHEALIAQVSTIVEVDEADLRFISGVPVFRVTVNAHTISEILFFAPITGFLICSLLFWMFRTPVATLAGLAPGTLASLAMAALMSAVGIPLTLVIMILPSILLALGCAFAMHLLSAASVGPGELLRRLSPVVLPVALSGLTTAVGLVCIGLVEIELVRQAAVLGSFGVLIVTLATLSLVPALLKRFPLPEQAPRGHRFARERIAGQLTRIAASHAGKSFVVWGALTVALASALPRLTVETDATKWLGPGHPVRDHYDRIGGLLSGISPMNVVIESVGEAGEQSSVLDDGALAAIDALTRHLESQPGVGKALSVADPLRQLHGGFEGDDAQPLPRGRPLVEQYLLLLEAVPQLEDLLTDDRLAANIMLRVDDNASAHLTQLGDLATEWWREHGPQGYRVQATGIMYEFARAEDEIAHGQLRGLAAALLIIAGLILCIFGNLRLALVCLVPNLIPLVLIFGTMALVGAPLDAGTAMLGGLALGIAVDDTIHMASAFAKHAARYGPGSVALRATLADVLPAIGASTLIIGAAFGIIGLSEFSFTSNLGWLTATMMVLCLLADVTLLSPLLIRFPAKGEASEALGLTGERGERLP